MSPKLSNKEIYGVILNTQYFIRNCMHKWFGRTTVATLVHRVKGDGRVPDGLTQMMVAAYKQWDDIEWLLGNVGDDLSPKLKELTARHEKYRAAIEEAERVDAGRRSKSRDQEGAQQVR